MYWVHTWQAKKVSWEALRSVFTKPLLVKPGTLVTNSVALTILEKRRFVIHLSEIGMKHLYLVK